MKELIILSLVFVVMGFICGVVGAKEKMPFWNGLGVITISIALAIFFISRLL